MSRPLLIAVALALAAAQPSARALCTSDGVPQPKALLERFTSADCDACWRDPATPRAGPDTLALDWVLPGLQGEHAPLSSVAIDEALERLYSLKREVPQRSSSLTSTREGKPVPLRIAQGGAFNDYVGTSMELPDPGRTRWHAWLLLVEKLPAGLEGSPVPRNLVRNVFQPDWARPAARAPGMLAETRAMRIADGAQPDRLRLVAVMQDGHGEMRAITQTECSE